MSAAPPAGEHVDGSRPEPPQNIATAIAEVSERASRLVQEEIELAKAEVSEKAARLMRGAVVGTAAGVFLLGALIFALIGCAWLLYWLLPVGTYSYFWGFFGMAAILVLLGILAGLTAARAVKRATPPVPTMAIEEARKIRDVVSNPSAEPAPAAAPEPTPPFGAAPAEPES